MNILARISLLLVIVLISTSAYIRLVHSGIGCDPWPQCYGHIGDPAADQASVHTGAVDPDSVPEKSSLALARPLHRLVASVLGVQVIVLAFTALRQGKARVISLCLLALTVYLALLGVRSGGLYQPAVIMGNLAGGFTMLGLLVFLVFGQNGKARQSRQSAGLAPWLIAALVILSLQIFIGGLVSANFASTACSSLPDCHGQWLPDVHLVKAFDLTRQHQLTGSGVVVSGPEQAAIHMLHRLVAVVCALLLVIAGILALRGDKATRMAGIAILLLVSAEFSVGVLAVTRELPISLAVLHNWLAALLVLTVLWLLIHNRNAA